MPSTLTLQYQAADPAASTTTPWVRLEQEPIRSGALTQTDLLTMLALVQAGTSAHAYRPADCVAYIQGDQAHADLAVYAWPSRLDLAYSLTPLLVELGEVAALRQERDFDLVVPMSTSVDLPFLMDSLSTTWQTPCYNRFGQQVGPPAITHTGARLELSAEVFGVLRVRGQALGFRHALHFAMAKNAGSSITDITPVLTATWTAPDQGPQTERLEIDLPDCLTDLLALCPDGISQRAHALGQVTDPNEGVVPVIYYSTCTGQVLALRYERP
jgi:hypothetical protein